MADSSSIKEHSYGIILKRPNPSITQGTAVLHPAEETQILLVYQKTLRQELGCYWGFPKGHPEKGDPSPQHTAIRELEEETGIRISVDDIEDIDDVFQTVHINPVTQQPKASRFWVAQLKREQDVKILEKEIANYRWCAWDEASKLLTFDDLKDILIRIRRHSMLSRM